VIRERLRVPPENLLAISIAIGYPDWDFPANKVQSEREHVESFTAWRGI